jgi:23S rRNA (adenine2030-N6)-methyltransferase
MSIPALPSRRTRKTAALVKYPGWRSQAGPAPLPRMRRSTRGTIGPMLAYRHAFHAGNHADVLKHLVLMLVLQHMNGKEKGWRYVDTHAGAGGYSLESDYAKKKGEAQDGILRVLERADLPPPLAELVGLIRSFNDHKAVRQYPGSPALAHLLMRAQDQLRLSELHPTDHKILASYLGGEPGIEVKMVDGFGALKTHLPPPTRRGVVLIDPSYEIKTDYTRTLAAVRETLERFADAVVLVWLPQVQLVQAAQLPQRLKAAADAHAKKGWLHARLTVAQADARGFGMLGSSMLVVNPPHTLFAQLQPVLPYLAKVLAQFDGAASALDRSRSS